MPRKRRRSKIDISAKATAKVEASAKASLQRKKNITEVIPPDVTRAKAARWLDLISPITEWAGLKGDALRYRRSQLRIQQEASLERLAKSIQKKIEGQAIVHPLPPKILIPALEAVSLEDVESPLLDWWADLLVTGVTSKAIRPYLIDLMSKPGPEEAKYIERQWELASYGDESQLLQPVYSRFTLYTRIKTDIYSIMRRETKTTGDAWRTETTELFMNAARESWLTWSKEHCCIAARVTLPWIGSTTRNIIDGGSVPQDICLGLRLIDYHNYSETFDTLGLMGQHWQLEVLQFSELGVEFMKACRPSAQSSKGGAKKWT